jgi:Uma2 family endonuclease
MAADPMVDLRRRFTVDEYELMGRVGALADDRTELLGGEIIAMSPIGPRHASVVERITRRLYRATGDDVSIRVQNPVRLIPDSEPEPDIVVATGRRDYYASAHPAAEDILLVIEVADTSPALDQVVKLPIYADHYVVEAWVVDVKAGVVHVHTDPNGDEYRTVHTLGRSDELVPTAVKGVRIAVSDIV